MVRKIIILGATGNCIDILDTISSINASLPSPRYDCIGFLDDDKLKWNKKIQGKPIIGGLNLVSECKDVFFINGIGSPSSFLIRKKIVAQTGLPNEQFETIVHPTASVSKFSNLGCGVVVFQNVTITTKTTIGHHVCILPNSVLSHDSKIGNYTCVAGGAIVSGNVRIGNSCYLGANCSIKQGIVIGNQCLIGMGSVVLNDVKENSVIAGNPAKFLRPLR